MFQPPKMTNAGKALYYQSLAGEGIHFTQIKLGKGTLTSAIATMTDLVDAVVAIDASVSSGSEKTYVDISGSFSNAGLEGFYWREIGLFAVNPDAPNDRTKDIMYCYQSAYDTADFIPAASVETVEKHITIPLVVADADNISCILDHSLIYATKQDVDDHNADPDAHPALRELIDEKGGGVAYGTCDTAASTTEKAVVCEGFTLETGAAILVRFTNANSAASPTLNVNGAGAAAIAQYGSTAPEAYMWKPGAAALFVYDGAVWLMSGAGAADTTYYGPTKLSDSVASTSVVLAATANAVKTAYNKAVSAKMNTVAVNGSYSAAANGCYSIAVGTNAAVASYSSYSIAVGYAANVAQKAEGAIAIGCYAAASGCYGSIAIGTNSHTNGYNAVSLGVGANAGAESSLAIGRNALIAYSGSYSIAIGYNASANGANSVAMGVMANASAGQAVAIGESAAGGMEAVAIGHNSASAGLAAVAIGDSANAAGNSVAVGPRTNASGGYSVAMGCYTTASGANSISIGMMANATGTGAVSIGGFVNAGANSVAMGSGANASAAQAVAIGRNSAAAGGQSSLAVGFSANASGDGSVAVGYAANAVSDAVAMGSYASAAGTQSLALGCRASAANSCSVAIGYNAAATAENTIQLGDSGVSALKCAVSLTTTSDLRDKTDVENVPEGAVALFEQIQPITYLRNPRVRYIPEELSDDEREKLGKYGLCAYDKEAHAAGEKKGARRRLGVAAQQVREALEAVYGADFDPNLVDDNFHDLEDVPEDVENQLSVNYEAFVPLLIQAVRELSAKISVLEGKVNGE